MGYVYFPKDGVKKIKACDIPITDGGIGYRIPQPQLDKLVIARILKRISHKSVTFDGQEMNSSYDALLRGVAEKQLDLKPEPVVEEAKVEEPEVEEAALEIKEERDAEIIDEIVEEAKAVEPEPVVVVSVEKSDDKAKAKAKRRAARKKKAE